MKRNNVNARSHILSLYGEHNLNDSLVLSEVVSFSKSNVHTKSAKALAQDAIAKGKLHNKSFNALATLGYKLDTGSNVNLIPSFGLNYGWSKDSGHTEKGAGIHNLSFKSKKSQNLSAILGITAAAPIYLKHLYYDTNNSIFDRKCGTKTSARVHMIWT